MLSRSRGTPAYVELHCHSCFSLLDGVSRPEALVARAVELGMAALALTDHDALYGAVSFWRAATEAGIKPIFGAEVGIRPFSQPMRNRPAGTPPGSDGGIERVRDRPAGTTSLIGRASSPGSGDRFHLTLLALDATGYANLSKLITTARMRCEKGEAEASWEDLVAHSQGLIALSGCRQGEIAMHLQARQFDAARQAARRLREVFGPDRLYVEVQRQLRPGDERLAQALIALADQERLPIVATNDVHYAIRPGHRLHDALVAIRHLATLDASYPQRRGNSEAHLKGAVEMVRLFADRPDALANTLAIAERCNVSLRYGVQDLPQFPVPALAHPPGGSAGAVSNSLADPPGGYLRRLCEAALAERYDAVPGEGARRMLDHELAVIGRLGLANYFLIVWDILRFARSQGIRCQGRGSAANSLVAYLLGITPIDPLAHDLVFERFLSDERASLPDIDIDFDALRREEVIQYVYARYGRDHAAMACNLVTFQTRSAVRDVGRALDFPPDLIDALAHAADRVGLEEAWQEVMNKERGTLNAENSSSLTPPPSFLIPHSSFITLLQLCQQIHGLPRHLGIHNGGMVLSGPPLAEIVPLEPARMEERTVCQWDKEALEDAGLVKIDLLGLRMLSALEEALGVVEETTGRRPDLDRLPFDDPAVYDMICRGDTIGCFQVESRAQSQLIPHFQPRCFDDLIVEISLIRPGPIQGNMVQPYLRRRQGKEPVTYLHPRLEPALAETLGVIVFQEQVLKIARDLAGWTGGQGELLRRAMGRNAGRGAAEMERLRGAFVAGAVAQGVPAEVAEAVFQQLKAFGGYAFAKSHAASFAVIVYQSAWLKRYHPLAFIVGLLRCQPMGFYSPAVLVNDAKRHGIAVLPVDANRSGVEYEAESGAIRIGLSTIKGIGEQGARRIVAARGVTPFASLADFCRRTRLPRLLVENFIAAGALDSLLPSSQPATHRRDLLWQLGLLDYAEETLIEDEPDPAPDELPPLSPLEALSWELKTVGVSAGDHVMSHYRVDLAQRGVLSSRDLAQCRHGQMVWVAGQVTVIQSPPTAKGFWFITLEDEFGMINIIVAPAAVARYRRIWRGSPFLMVWGKVQKEGSAVNLLGQQPQRMAFQPVRALRK